MIATTLVFGATSSGNILYSPAVGNALLLKLACQARITAPAVLGAILLTLNWVDPDVGAQSLVLGSLGVLANTQITPAMLTLPHLGSGGNVTLDVLYVGISGGPPACKFRYWIDDAVVPS